ncbi:hypothetical protein F0562_027253 [Nyssa sinensis]|uniref:Transcription repressor n=1 Tax=Nyssa sinensis TaxID=561372 RepID=A0A5J5B2W9_9ASTE|nr:hypothetical protein F0562_027253 [Nyssa sinensis]
MAKRFRFRLSLPSFQFCRSKQPSCLPQSPQRATYQFSPINPKAFDIAYPNIPDPPPSTPNYTLFQSQATPKIMPVSCRCRSRSCKHYNPGRKINSSSVSDDSDEHTWPVTLPKAENNKKKAKASVCISTSSADSGWLSSEGGDYNEETESLLSSSISFDSSNDFGYSLESISERPINRGRRKKKKNLRVRRLRRYVSQKMTPMPESASPMRTSVFRRLIPCTMDGKMKESFAVERRSEDPYEDFKKSMLEMIIEKQMFESKDLEQLLQCFLSLNSRHHHAAIVQAFSEIWELLFSKSSSPLEYCGFS